MSSKITCFVFLFLAAFLSSVPRRQDAQVAETGFLLLQRVPTQTGKQARWIHHSTRARRAGQEPPNAGLKGGELTPGNAKAGPWSSLTNSFSDSCQADHLTYFKCVIRTCLGN